MVNIGQVILDLVDVLEEKAQDGVEKLKSTPIDSPDFGHILDNTNKSINISQTFKSVLMNASKKVNTNEDKGEC